MNRRELLKGGAFLAVSGALGTAFAMRPDEQAAHDAWHRKVIAKPDRLIDSPPVLMAAQPTSMGVVFAVNGLSLGFAEVSETSDFANAQRFKTVGMPFAQISTRVQKVRMTGLKPATKYHYRIGAAALGNAVGYWRKTSEIEWGEPHVFTTPGAAADSSFAVINDTHGRFDAFERLTDRIRSLGVAALVWNGDAAYSKIETEEAAVGIFLKPQIANPAYAADIPMYFLHGNHDHRGLWNQVHGDDILMTRTCGERGSGFAAIGHNFAVRQGDIALIGLETGEDKPDWHPSFGGCGNFRAFRELQTKWLKLQFRRPEIADAPFKVAFCHIPLFSPDPNANNGEVLEDFASWQGFCAQEWGPILNANGVSAVIAGHTHHFRFDKADGEKRRWDQIVGGGPNLGSANPACAPTVIAGKVVDGKLVITVHSCADGTVLGSWTYGRVV